MNLDLEGHTVRRYDADLNHCHLRVLELGGIVLQQLIEALGALQKWDVPEARTVIERDEGVRQLEKAVDVELVQVIARRTPVAGDLRAVIGMCKMVADLGRVEEKVLRLAEFTASVFDEETGNPPDALLKDITAMGARPWRTCVKPSRSSTAGMPRRPRRGSARAKSSCRGYGPICVASRPS